MAETAHSVLKRLRWPLRLTWAGLLAERLAHSFWPLWSVVIAALAALMLGLQDIWPIEVVWALAVVTVVATAVFGIRGALAFRWPSGAEALARLDATLPGRPIAALLDDQAIGRGDADSVAVWRVHQARMAARAATAHAVPPDLHLSPRDPFGLRFIALQLFLVALLFGSVWRVGSVSDIAPGGSALAAGPTWEGWVEPPAYTGKPSLYLSDIKDVLSVPQGSTITLRLYGEVGALTVAETVSGRTEAPGSAADPAQTFDVVQDGQLDIAGPGGRGWRVVALPDTAPVVQITGPIKADAKGQLSQPFHASDDYGIRGGRATVTLDLATVERRHGLAIAPDPREALTLDLPLPITGSREDFDETLVENLSEHPWANLPVTLRLQVFDDRDQTGSSDETALVLPGRRFFDPLAAAIIEQRRDLLWSRANAPRVAQILRAVSHRPEGFFRKQTAFLRLRVILRRLEAATARGGLQPALQEEITAALWDLALQLEDGDLSDAMERMRQAQERLNQAMKNGASDAEIAQLMQELRDATQDYLRQLAQQQREDGEGQDQQSAESTMQMTADDLQKMMDRIQELMEQGRMAEAQQALEEFQRMMENMRVTEGQGQGDQSPGQQAMDGLAETLRDQQGLSDQAFRDLQEQFNPDAQAGENAQNEGRNGGQGRGQSHEGQPGQGEGQGDGEGEQGEGQSGDRRADGPQGGGQQGGDQQGSSQQQSLADRQQALRRELERQRGTLPGAGSEEGKAARDALDRAGRAMDDAEQALRGNELAEAIDKQAEAMEALREGIRNLGEALAQNQRENPGQQGQAEGQASGNQQRDPLGRLKGSPDVADNMLQGEDVYRRARDLLDEIRRRTGEASRPDSERSYLKRLLDRF